MATTTFTYTGAAQTYTVPAGVTSVVIDAVGPSGAPYGGSGGGTGSHIRGTLAVTPGQTLQVNVGGCGLESSVGTSPGLGGWNGGANGGFTVGAGTGNAGNGGGGMSDVRQGGTAWANIVIAAAGGGGAANSYQGGGGGSLGGNGSPGGGTAGNAGLGGTQTAGGAATGGSGTTGAAGTAGAGGGGTTDLPNQNAGGGGAAGYYGGSGGGATTGTGANAGAGGGGSSWAGACTSTSTVLAGVTGGNPYSNPNDGYISITTTDTAPNAPTLTAPLNNGFADVSNTAIAWTFSDPDSGDTQSSADVRYRAQGTTNWTTLSGVVTGTTSTYQLTGLTVGVQYEWQVRTYDAQGTVGPYSSSSFFTVKAHPVVTILTPASGAPITSLAGQALTLNQVRDQSGATFRRVGDINGQPDTTNIIETATLGSASLTTHNFTSTSHNDGPEHWQVQVQTFSGQIVSDWVDVYVVMSVDAPPTPTCTVTALPNSGAMQVQVVFAEASVDYFSASSLPTTADTGQALTNAGSTGTVSGGYYTNTQGNTTSQSMTLTGKVLSMQCSFRQAQLGSSTHTNSVSMIATDASNNAHIYCTSTAAGWSISKDVAGSLTTLASGSYATSITTSALNAYPWSMSATVSGTTVTFIDPFGVTHTATDAVIGSFTGTIARMQIANIGTGSTHDTWKVAHWSASSTAANIPVTGYISRSLDGVTFTPIPGAVWDTQEYGSVFTYTDYTPSFNRRVWYRITSVTAAGAIAQSVVS
jgi:hypothetical protein